MNIDYSFFKRGDVIEVADLKLSCLSPIKDINENDNNIVYILKF